MIDYRAGDQMTLNGIQFDDRALAALCRQHGIARMSLFGSVLGSAFRDDSDVDFLVEFEPGRRISLLGLGGIAIELRQLIGREVDLRTPQDLSQYFRDEVVRSARLVYAA